MTLNVTATKLLLDTLKKGFKNDFFNLIEDWGKWSRYFGCVGYHTGHSAVTPINIDDTTALILNEEFNWLKAYRKQLWWLVDLRYIKGLTSSDISYRYFKKEQFNFKHGTTRGKNSFTADPIAMSAYKLNDPKSIDIVLNDALRLIYIRLKRKYLNDSF